VVSVRSTLYEGTRVETANSGMDSSYKEKEILTDALGLGAAQLQLGLGVARLQDSDLLKLGLGAARLWQSDIMIRKWSLA